MAERFPVEILTPASERWQLVGVTVDGGVNHLVVSYVSAAHDYTEIEAGIVQDEEDIEARGEEKSETLQLTSVRDSRQALHLGKRKLSRLTARRRGSVRARIYGLNGLGERYIRVKYPKLASMADVVVEVMQVQFDPARGEVVFDVIQADTTLDENEAVPTPPPEVVDRPPGVPGRGEPAERPTVSDIPFATSASVGEIAVTTHTVVRKDGSPLTLPPTILSGLAPMTTYGVFYRADVGYEVEAFPATAHMQTGSWLFVGWQDTPSTGGAFPEPPPRPPGSGGAGLSPDTPPADL